jgi:hypothetical protein
VENRAGHLELQLRADATATTTMHSSHDEQHPGPIPGAATARDRIDMANGLTVCPKGDPTEYLPRDTFGCTFSYLGFCQTTKRLGHRRRSTAEEADRRGRPLAGPEPTANPVSQMPRLRH